MGYKESDKRRYKKMLNIQQLFDSSAKLKRLGVIENSKQLEIYARWPELVGIEVSKRSRPLKFRNGVLTVTVSSHTWMQQLTMLKPTVLQALRDNLGEGIVRDIKLTTRDWQSGGPAG